MPPLINVCTKQIISRSDTVSRSGMFCAIATTIEKCKAEGVVDVFQVVKALRVQKPGAVCTVVSLDNSPFYCSNHSKECFHLLDPALRMACFFIKGC